MQNNEPLPQAIKEYAHFYVEDLISLDPTRQQDTLNCVPGSVYSGALLARSIRQQTPIYSFDKLNIKVGLDSFLKEIKESGARLAVSCDMKRYKELRLSYVWPDGEILIRCSINSAFSYIDHIVFITVNLDLFNNIKEIINKYPDKDNDGSVSVLLSGPGGLYAQSIGVGGVALERDNYTENTLLGYDSIVKDLLNKNPLGRLSIIDGPPGTGKTFIVRGLLNDAKRAKFLILPSNAAEEMSGPNILSSLIDLSSSNKESKVDDKADGPVVLVIEDADRCLSVRKSDNVSAISTILNLSDGIIGNLLDLRIVCTTNAEVGEMDSALLRPGRLSARIDAGLLPKNKAIEVFKRITKDIKDIPEVSWDDKFYSLAQVYAMAKGKTEIQQFPQLKNKRAVGFSSNEP